MSKEPINPADVEVLEKQIRQNREEIDRLKQEVDRLRAELGLSETDEFEAQFNRDEVLEFGTLGNSVVKGRINWMNPYVISITTSEEDRSAEVLIFKHALAYIRKPEEKSTPRRGMYI
jgi:sRNA-binding regulator protein Hfq